MPKDISLFMDYYKVIPPSTEQITTWNDSFSINQASPNETQSLSGFGLEVTLEATHSAFFNDNMRFYIPSRMEDGARSFINRRKPAKILKHHDSMSDPVGIVIGSEYIHTIPEELQSNKDIQILTDSSFPIRKQIAAAKRLIKSGIPFRDDWRGLGYIELKAMVFDQKTIGQIKNRLFDAVSTSFVSPGQVYCSECGTNLAVDGFCEHEPGGKYKDSEDNEVPCALIPGLHKYEECSLVVFDADPLTAIQISDSKSNKNKIYSMPDYWKNSSPTNNSKFLYEFKDFKEENIMGKNQIELSDTQKEVFDFVDKLRPELDNEIKIEFAQKIANLKNEEGNYPDQIEAELDLETYVLYAVENFETADQKINAEEIYEEMSKSLQEDAKLSAETLNKLPNSIFCGPEKSFPVPDSAHAVVAKQLINTYKGPGDKVKILARINHREKALGENNKDSIESKQDLVVTEEKMQVPTCDALKTLSDSEAKELFNLIETEVVSRQLKFSRPCGKCAVAEDTLNTVKVELEDTKNNVKDLEDTLRVLRAEMKFQMEDYFRQVDHQVLLDLELKTTKKDKLALMSVLSGKHKNIEEANDSLKDVDIEKETAIMNDSFKLDDILTRLNDGMSNKKPKGQVEDPTLNKDKDNKQLPEDLKPQARAAIRNIKEFSARGQKKQAKALYDRMVAMNYFSTEDVPFEIISVESTIE